MNLLESTDFCGYVAGTVIRRDLYGCLKNYSSVVITVVDMMDGYTCLALTGCDNGLMDTHAIHAFSAEFRQQRRVDIYNAPAIAFDQTGRYHQQETGKHDKVNILSRKQVDNCLSGGKVIAADCDTLYAEPSGAFNDGRRLTVGDNESDPRPSAVTTEVFYQIFGVRTLA